MRQSRLGRRIPGSLRGGHGEEPLVWRHRFPQDIVDALVSFATPKGAINNSELELAGFVGHNSVLSDHRDTAETNNQTLLSSPLRSTGQYLASHPISVLD